MSAPEPDLPRDPAEYRPRPLMGVTFWAMIAFGLICVLAGVGVATLAPRLLAPKPEAPAEAPPAPPEPTAPAAAVAPPPPAEEVARLKAHIVVLENAGARSSEAAAAALAVAEVVEASRGSRPFAAELAALRAAAPDLPELAALTPLAQAGAPSRTALAVTYPDYAARAARQARRPAEGADLGARLAYVAAKVVSVRRVDDAAGDHPDALLARAEQALQDGEVVFALKLLDGLPPSARDALAPWRAGAERRAEIDRQVSALRGRAVRALAPQEPPA